MASGKGQNFVFWTFVFRSFEFGSNFGFRAWDLTKGTGYRCQVTGGREQRKGGFQTHSIFLRAIHELPLQSGVCHTPLRSHPIYFSLQTFHFSLHFSPTLLSLQLRFCSQLQKRVWSKLPPLKRLSNKIFSCNWFSFHKDPVQYGVFKRPLYW